MIEQWVVPTPLGLVGPFWTWAAARSRARLLAPHYGWATPQRLRPSEAETGV